MDPKAVSGKALVFARVGGVGRESWVILVCKRLREMDVLRIEV